MIFQTKGQSVRFWMVRFLAAMMVFVLAFPSVAEAKKKQKQSDENARYAAIVVDADTGVILHQSNPDKKLHPASLTKVMTLLLLFDAMDAGKVGLNDSIRVSRRAAAASPSKLGLSAGSSIRVKDAILALVTKSANDMAIAVAEHVGGSEENFARMMTSRAHELGMNNTTFRNASGLHNPGQVSSARDMAIMARYVINRYPSYYRFFATHRFTYQGRSYDNHNHLMETYKGMDGMKTGFINQSGFNLVASAVRGNQRLIGVVFGGRSANSRNARMKDLLDQGFRDIKRGEPQIASAGNVLKEALPFERADAPVPDRKPSTAQPDAPILTASAQPALVPVSAVPAAPVAPVAAAPLTAADASTVPPADPAAVQKVIGEKLSSLNSSFQNSHLAELLGQGDYDDEQAKRIETGMMAIAAHTGQSLSAPRGPILRTPGRLEKPVALASFAPPLLDGSTAMKSRTPETWAIQIGAYTSRVATDQAIQKTLSQMPAQYASVSPMIVPLRTQDGWLFRGRLNGFATKEAAANACAPIKDCIPVAPYEQ